MANSYTKEQSAFKPPKKEVEKKKPKPIPKVSEKKKAELEDRKNWTAEQFLQAQKEIKNDKRLQKQKPKSTPISVIKHDLNVIYSLVVRMEPADSDGMVKCFCCSNRFEHWSKIQNGHFLKRSTHPSLIFCRKNTNPQSYYCNIILKGNELPYLQNMKKVYGENILEELQVLGLNKSGKGAFEYQIMLQEYIELFLIQCKRLNHTPTKIQQKIVDKWKQK
jgi:hypothetical protein